MLHPEHRKHGERRLWAKILTHDTILRLYHIPRPSNFEQVVLIRHEQDSLTSTFNKREWKWEEKFRCGGQQRNWTANKGLNCALTLGSKKLQRQFFPLLLWSKMGRGRHIKKSWRGAQSLHSEYEWSTAKSMVIIKHLASSKLSTPHRTKKHICFPSGLEQASQPFILCWYQFVKKSAGWVMYVQKGLHSLGVSKRDWFLCKTAQVSNCLTPSTSCHRRLYWHNILGCIGTIAKHLLRLKWMSPSQNYWGSMTIKLSNEHNYELQNGFQFVISFDQSALAVGYVWTHRAPQVGQKKNKRKCSRQSKPSKQSNFWAATICPESTRPRVDGE